MTQIEHLGFGGASLTSIGNAKTILTLLEQAFESGIYHYDTAAIYGKGYSEILYGKFLKDKRKEITITSKFGFQSQLFYTNKHFLHPLLFLNKLKTSIVGSAAKNSNADNLVPESFPKRTITKNEIEKSFLQSLKNLQTSYIDYYMLHEALPSFLTEEATNYLLQLKQNGDILKLGIASNVNFIKDLTNREINNWDILQYEGFDKELKQLVMEKFPEKTHFHHSVLKNATSNDVNEKIIHDSLLENLNGKVIFSTRRIKKLQDTVKFIKLHGDK